MRRPALTLVFALTSLVALPAAAEARYDPYTLTGSYKVSATISSTSYTKSVCSDGTHTITEEATQVIVANRTGSGKLGTKRRPTKGSMKSGGTRTLTWSKVVQGPDAAAPQSGSATEQLGSSSSASSPIERSLKKRLLLLQLNVSTLEGNNGVIKVKPPRKGKSVTVPISEDTPSKDSSDGNMCTYTERSSVKGGVTVTRTR
jgi:hypothetical protein